MLTLMRNGGFPMFFIVAFGLVGLGGAVRYALKPSASRLGFVKGMALATLFSTLTGTCADLATVWYALSDLIAANEPKWPAMMVQGLAESTSPGIMGFTLLSLIALIAAVGRARDAGAVAT